MKIYLAAIVVFLLLWILSSTLFQVQEHFQGSPEENDPAFQKTYRRWRALYLDFMKSWKKALTTSVALERPAPAEGASTPPPVTVQEMNQYIQILSQKLGQPLPFVQDDEYLPGEKPDLVLLQIILTRTNTEPEHLRNATQWVNEQLEASFAKMDRALKGEGFLNVEGYVGGQCNNLAGCIEDNPEEADRVIAALENRKRKQTEAQKINLKQKMDATLADAGLTAVMAKNRELFAKAKDLENQASSGALLDQLNLPGMGEKGPKYELPEDANRLKDLERSDPEKYKKLKDSYGQFFSLKTTMDQINSVLR